jgi:acid phosphatase
MRALRFTTAVSFALTSWLVSPDLAAQQSAVQVTSTTTAAAAGPHDQLYAVLWQQRSAEYRAACLQAFATARHQLDLALENPRWTACLEQTNADEFTQLPPAVVVDVDETILDNSAFAARQIQAGAVQFDAVAWRTWVHEQQATPIPGALPFLLRARQLGVRIFYVTNRKADGQGSTEETDTRANLRRFGFPLDEGDGEDLVLCAGEHGDKATRRALVCQSHRVVLLVGDNLGDFAPGTELRKADQLPSGLAAEAAVVERARNALVHDFAEHWGTRWILVPNPVYGGWESVLLPQDGGLRGALRAKG